jgi:hypothetical protein
MKMLDGTAVEKNGTVLFTCINTFLQSCRLKSVYTRLLILMHAKLTIPYLYMQPYS